jgi:hypothetical protein
MNQPARKSDVAERLAEAGAGAARPTIGQRRWCDGSCADGEVP